MTVTSMKGHTVADETMTVKIMYSDLAGWSEMTPVGLEPRVRLGDAVKGKPDAEETIGKPQELIPEPLDVASAKGGPWRDDLVAAILGTTLVCGLFLDGWNHINLQNGALGDFFTIWHALLYAGFSATAGWVVSRNSHLYATGRRPKWYFHRVLGFPLRYPVAVAGIVVATIGLF